MNNFICKIMQTFMTVEQWESFKWRVINTFKSVVLPIVLSMVLVQLQNHPNDLTCLGEVQFWMNIGYAVLVAIVGSTLAGLEKVNRMRVGKSTPTNPATPEEKADAKPMDSDD